MCTSGLLKCLWTPPVYTARDTQLIQFPLLQQLFVARWKRGTYDGGFCAGQCCSLSVSRADLAVSEAARLYLPLLSSAVLLFLLSASQLLLSSVLLPLLAEVVVFPPLVEPLSGVSRGMKPVKQGEGRLYRSNCIDFNLACFAGSIRSSRVAR